jgi:small-conductance mechanosensitive channel
VDPPVRDRRALPVLGGRPGGAAALLAVVLLPAAVVSAAQATAGDPADVEVATAPVTVDGAVLFRVRGVTSFPAPARARLIADRITAAAADRDIPLDAFRIVDDAAATRIVVDDAPIMAVVDADATLEQLDRRTLAAVHLTRLREAVADYRAARSPAALRRAAIAAGAGTAVLILGVAALLRFWRWLDRVLARRLQTRIHSVGIQAFELMRAEQIWRAVCSGIHAVRAVVFLAVALVYLGFVLSRFPGTRGLSQGIAGFALGPLEVIGRGIAAHLPGLLFVVVLAFLVRLALKLVRLFFEAIAAGTVRLGGFDREWAEPTYKIVRLATVAFALVVAYPYIPGSNTAAFQGVSLFIGLVVSLGSSSAIANIVAGYMMTYRRALRVGDRVKIGEAIGDVIETRLQVTHIRSPKNEEIIIPNSQILASEVINYSSLARAQGLILHTEVGIGYETPWRQVESMLLAAAGRTAGLSKEPEPFVLEKRLGDFAVVYELNAYCADAARMYEMYAELHRHILDVFNERAVQIMTPAYVMDPPEPKLVPAQDRFAAPAAGR